MAYPTAAYTLPWAAARRYVLVEESGVLTGYSTNITGIFVNNNGYVASQNSTYYKYTFNGTSWSSAQTLTGTLSGSYYNTTILVSSVLFCNPGLWKTTNDGTYLKATPFELPFNSTIYTLPWVSANNYIVIIEDEVVKAFVKVGNDTFYCDLPSNGDLVKSVSSDYVYLYTFNGTSWSTSTYQNRQFKITQLLYSKNNILYSNSSTAFPSTPLVAPSESYSGSSSIDQSSTLEALGNTQRFGSSAISQSSSIVATGEKYESVGVTGSAEITQSSTVQATGFKSISDSSQVSQESTVSASATSNRLGQSSITNESTVLATGKKSISDRAEISQGSSTEAIGTKSVSVQASISQGSTVYAIGIKYVAPEEHDGSCAISQDSTVETSSYKGGKGSVSVANESTVVVTGSKATSSTGLVLQVYTIVGLGYKTANGQASISQGSTVKATRNAKLTKKYGNVIQFDKTQQMTAKPVNHGIVVQMNKDTEGEIKLNAPFRKDVEL